MTSPTPFRFAISATFTAEPVQPVLEFWSRRLNANFEVRFAPYNQVIQSVLDPASEFAANHHGVNVLLARVEDLGEDPARIESNIAQFVGVLREAPAHLSVPVIVVLCPASPAFCADPARAAASNEASARMAAMLHEVPGLQLVSPTQLARLYPVEEIHSAEGERLGKIPYTELYFTALGTMVVRLAHALFAPPFKVIALDCDNTLWQGICGEDGPQGVVIDAGRRALQQFMADQREQGMLLTLASKNNEGDVIETFDLHPEMVLRMRHFVAWRLNWESKAISLAEMAQELSLGLDSFIFVDDNPKECAEVGEELPEVLSLALPEDASAIPHFLDHVWAFDHPVVTEEDRNRNAYYSQSQEFGRELRRSVSLEHFMETLGLQLRFEPLIDDRLARVAQLTQRTNQFNFTTIRRSEADIQALVREGGLHCLTLSLADRFGDYGLVGVMIYGVEGGVLDVDTLLLSCRALGRGVEHRMMARLGEEAQGLGLNRVKVSLFPTKKNHPARKFLEEIGVPPGDPMQHEFDSAQLASLKWRPSAGSLAAPGPKPKKAVASARRFVEFAEIARSLSTPREIYEAMRRDVAFISKPEVEPLTETEQKLAAIWSDLLKRPTIRPADNFFDLGGHSLLAVMLIMRVREDFGIELPIDDVYSATLTLGELARKVEMYQMGVVDPGEYEALLAEIESLSDDEVRRLLAEEDPAGHS